MRRLALVPLGLATVLALACGAPEPEPEPEPAADETPAPPQFAETGEHPCDPVGEIGFICDMVSPEDIATIPGDEWAITSGAREGGRLHLLNVTEKTSTLLFPTPDRVEQLDAETYPECPGPIPNPDDSRPHGLYLDPGDGDVHSLLVVHHGQRESIEVFEVDAGSAPPAIAWVGCAVAPEEANFNSVVALPEGGLATTHFGVGVWEWHTDSGWELLPESEDTAPNGIEVSADGKFVFIAGWAEEKLTRLSRGMTPVQKDVVPTRVPARQPADVARTARRSSRQATPTRTAIRSPVTESRRWRRPTWRQSTWRRWKSIGSSCSPPSPGSSRRPPRRRSETNCGWDRTGVTGSPTCQCPNRYDSLSADGRVQAGE